MVTWDGVSRGTGDLDNGGNLLEGLHHLGEAASELDVDRVDGCGGDLDEDVIWLGDLWDGEVVGDGVLFWLCPLEGNETTHLFWNRLSHLG